MDATRQLARSPEADPDRVIARLIHDDDIGAIADHLQLCFGVWPPFGIDCSVSEHVAWKLNPNPRSRASQMMVTHKDDDHFPIAVSIRAFLEIWIQGRERVLRTGGDAAVHPDWRRMNIGQKRHELRAELGFDIGDLSLAWLPHHPATRKRTLDWPALGNRVLVFWKPAGLRSLVSVPARSAGWGRAIRAVLEAMRGSLRERFAAPQARFGGIVVSMQRFDDRTDAIWDSAKDEFDLAIVRNQEYLNWRYADPRAGRFAIRAAIEGEAIVGYCVLRPSSDPAEIVDLLVRPGRLDAVDALLADADALVRGEGVRDIHCWLPQRHPYVGTLRRHGFLDAGRDPSLRYRARTMTEEELGFLLDPDARLHITHGDSDFV